MSRFLKGTIHVLNDDGSLNSVLRGTSEAAAKKQAPEAYKTWGDHVWVDQPDDVADDGETPAPAKRAGRKKGDDGDKNPDDPEGDGE